MNSMFLVKTYITYFFLKGPRNPSRNIHLVKQVSPYGDKLIVENYKDATSKEFTYSLYDFHQSTPEKVCLRSKILLSHGTITLHMNQNTV